MSQSKYKKTKTKTYKKTFLFKNLGKTAGSKSFKFKLPKYYKLDKYSKNSKLSVSYNKKTKILTVKVKKLAYYNTTKQIGKLNIIIKK